MQLTTTAVIRDTVTGACFLVPAAHHEAFDLERLDEAGYELSGWLQHQEQYREQAWSDVDGDSDEPDERGYGYDNLPVYQGPYFTECSRDDCDKQIVIIDDGAPEFCTDHEEEE